MGIWRNRSPHTAAEVTVLGITLDVPPATLRDADRVRPAQVLPAIWVKTYCEGWIEKSVPYRMDVATGTCGALSRLHVVKTALVAIFHSALLLS